MSEHSELVAEMTVIERMSNQERMKLARKRRNQQMKKWGQREKELTSKRKKTEQNMSRKPTKRKDYKVHFVPSVMLLEAAARNDIEEVRRLLMLGVSPDSTNEDGLTALHQCCIDDSEEMMKLLIEFGANVNAKDSEQWTPLHAAATCGLIHLVEYLISKGADLLSVNADGNMPYDICEDETTLDFIEVQMAKKGITQEMIDDTRAATEKRMLNDLKYLVENDEDIEYRDHQGATPLHIASANGYVTVVEYLLDQNVSLDVSDKDMWLPIHAAACWGHPDVIEVLVQAGADLSAKTKNGETPYDICEDPELKDRIIQLKCEMETKKGSQAQKLRRSQSQNTRSQSVRRTSIREKTQISRREALEEARIRHEKQEIPKPEEDEESKLLKDTREKETLPSSMLDPEDIELALTPLTTTNGGRDTLQKFKGRLALDFDSSLDDNQSVIEKTDHSTEKGDQQQHNRQRHLQWENTKEQNVKNNHNSSTTTTTTVAATVVNNNNNNPLSSAGSPGKPGTATSAGIPTDASMPTNSYSETKSVSGESVTVEILVTFNASPTFTPNPGTLADLKKQRNDIRNSSISSNGSASNGVTTPQSGATSTVVAQQQQQGQTGGGQGQTGGQNVGAGSGQNGGGRSSQPDIVGGLGVGGVGVGTAASKLGANKNGHCITATYNYEPPPSPSVSLQKYKSDPSEIVGEPQNKGCCSVM